MAGVPFAVTSGKISTGTSLKTIINVLAKTNHRVEVDEIRVGFFGTNSGDAPALVEILQLTTAGTGGAAVTPAKDVPSDPEALDVTAAVVAVTTAAWTNEPARGAVHRAQPVHPQTSEVFHFPKPLVITGSGTDRLGVSVTASTDVVCLVTVKGRE